MRRGKGKWENGIFLYKGVRFYFKPGFGGMPALLRYFIEHIREALGLLLRIFAIVLIFIGLDTWAENFEGPASIKNLSKSLFFSGETIYLFWLGITLLMILVFHRYGYNKLVKIDLKNKTYRYLITGKIKNGNLPASLDVSKSFDESSIQTLKLALDFAFKNKREANVYELVYATIHNKDIFYAFKKAKIPLKDFLSDIEEKSPQKNKKKTNRINSKLKKMAIYSLLEAIRLQDEKVLPKHLLMAVKNSPSYKNIFDKFKIDEKMF
ncbi:MAG: hypothetical protein GF335_02820 [Candidatus Moranbacteria bacterium]|nr:hypothetical protein [Candidatus Moranbacteria bacterium]